MILKIKNQDTIPEEPVVFSLGRSGEGIGLIATRGQDSETIATIRIDGTLHKCVLNVVVARRMGFQVDYGLIKES